jgi:hypothetical protein
MSKTPRPSLTLSLLESYFSTVKDLQTYLSDVLQPEASHVDGKFSFMPNDSDPPAYHTLLNASYVALTPAQTAERQNNPFKYKWFPAMLYMQDVRYIDIYSHNLVFLTPTL